MLKSKTVVIGDGWSALILAAHLGHADWPIYWIRGTDSQMTVPLPSLENKYTIDFFSSLLKKLNIDAGDLKTGVFLRECRNKTFRLPDTFSWKPEAEFTGNAEVRFGLTLNEIFESIRSRAMEFSSIQRMEGVPVQKLKIEGKQIQAVELSSGEQILCDRVFYTDRKHLPGPQDIFRGRTPIGALQATFTHDGPLLSDAQEGFYAPVQKEPGDEFDRHVFGHFSSDGLKSFWTLFLTESEAEDNHEITKKFRRIKQAAEKMFGSSSFLPTGKTRFMETVRNEQVRWIENAAFSQGNALTAPIKIPETRGLFFLSDGYGPASALKQVELLLSTEFLFLKQA